MFGQPCSCVLEPDNSVAVMVLFSFLSGHTLSSPLFLYDTVFVGYLFSFFIFCIFCPHIRHIFYPVVEGTMSHWAAPFYILDRCLELEMVVMYRNADLGVRGQNLQPTNRVRIRKLPLTAGS
ncbi:hypothetical protein SO802_001552 [Lithocarpus litseifolius]|uniref:Uncharacterized protein n=1 Tax=Lithocarpus litseifolius TaxID=425828 RepID=A0AAW2DY67_9ROSI